MAALPVIDAPVIDAAAADAAPPVIDAAAADAAPPVIDAADAAPPVIDAADAALPVIDAADLAVAPVDLIDPDFFAVDVNRFWLSTDGFQTKKPPLDIVAGVVQRSQLWTPEERLRQNVRISNNWPALWTEFLKLERTIAREKAQEHTASRRSARDAADKVVREQEKRRRLDLVRLRVIDREARDLRRALG